MKNKWLIFLGVTLSLFYIASQRSWVLALDCTAGGTPVCETYCDQWNKSGTCQAIIECDDYGVCEPTGYRECYCTDASDECLAPSTWGAWGACSYDEMADNYLQTRFCWPDTSIYQIRACTPDPGNGGNGGNGASPSPSPLPSPGDISGTVFLMDAGAEAAMVGGYCGLQSGTAEAGRPGGGSQVTASEGGTGGVVQAGGDYAIVDVPGSSSNSVTSSIGDPSTWDCDCPGSCVYGGKTPSITGLDYYVTDEWQGWFQSQGGNLHAEGLLGDGNMTVEIPAACEGDPNCEPYLIIEDDVSEATGLASYTGSLSVGDDGEVSTDGWQAQTSFQGLQTGYDYFTRILEDDPAGIGEWDGGLPEGEEIVVYSASGDKSTDGSWNVTGGKAVVILVDGNVLIDENIEVEVGSFLAIIASGNITVNNDVVLVQGVYIADGVIATCQASECGNSDGDGDVSDEQLVAEGIFAGWGGVDLRRDFSSSDNNIFPAELFIYRPDLQMNAYKYLLRPHYTWEEKAP